MTSITRIIHSNPHWNAYDGKPIDPADLARAAERGKEVQKWCEAYDLGLSDVHYDWRSSLVETGRYDEYAGYVEAWIQLREDTGLEVLNHEFKIMLPNGVVGHPDYVVRLNGDIVIPDLKVTAQPLLAHELQVVAYFKGLIEGRTEKISFIKKIFNSIETWSEFLVSGWPALFYLKDARKCAGKPYKIKRVKEQDISHHWAAFLAQARILECQTILDKHHARYG